MNAELVHADVQYQSVCIHHTVLTGELCVCVCVSVYPFKSKKAAILALTVHPDEWAEPSHKRLVPALPHRHISHICISAPT